MPTKTANAEHIAREARKHYFPLPEGWDEMSEDERQRTIDDYAENIISSRVTITGTVVEATGR